MSDSTVLRLVKQPSALRALRALFWSFALASIPGVVIGGLTGASLLVLYSLALAPAWCAMALVADHYYKATDDRLRITGEMQIDIEYSALIGSGALEHAFEVLERDLAASKRRQDELLYIERFQELVRICLHEHLLRVSAFGDPTDIDICAQCGERFEVRARTVA